MFPAGAAADAWVLNVGVTKGFTLFGVRVFASLSVDNLLDRRDIVYGGYEQMRFDEYTAADGRNAYRPFRRVTAMPIPGHSSPR